MNTERQSLISIIIPVFNEGKTIIQILERVLNSDIPKQFSKEIIIVDDCSMDNSKELIESFISVNGHISGIKLLSHDFNMGKGSAVKTGIQVSSGDFVLIQDADLEYDPDDYKLLLKPIIKGEADVVFGSRFVGSNPHRVLFFWHSIGNKILTTLSNMFTNLNLTDMESCYKLFRADLIKGIDLKEKSFGFEPEVTAKISKIPNIKIYEVGISYYGRTYAEGKKINWKDGFRALYCILRYNFIS